MEEPYYHTKESVEEYIRLAKDVSGQNLIEQLKGHLPAASTILEIGSGPGTDWNILSQTYNVTGSDNSSVFVEHLRHQNPHGTFHKLDAANLEVDQRFDAIYSNKVLHHLTDEDLASSLNRQGHILNDLGIVCHSFWKGAGTETFKGMFVNYHDKSELEQLFEPDFNLLVMEDYQEFEPADSILVIAQKNS